MGSSIKMSNQLALANRNNNPGNIKDDSGNFKVYSSPQEGYAALLNDLETKKSGNSKTGLKPDSTLADFSKTYAPASDSNNPAQYTVNLANHMGVRPDAKLSELDTGKWADAVANAEGYSNESTPSTNQQTAKRKTFTEELGTVSPDTQQYQTPQHSPERIAQYQGEQAGYDKNAKDANSASSIAGDTVKGIGDNLTFGGATTLGDQLGAGYARDYNQAKGLLGGKDNSKYIPEMDWGKTALGTLGTAAGALLTAAPGLKGITGGSNPLESPAILERLPKNLTKDAFLNLGEREKLNILGDIKNMATKTGAEGDLLDITKAIKSLQPKIGVLPKLWKTGLSEASKFALYNTLGSKVGGLIHDLLPK